MPTPSNWHAGFPPPGGTDMRRGLSQSFIGMTVIALAVSIEELARELPAALHGHPEISFGNVAGSVLSFFLFNAGIIALVRPLDIGEDTIAFYLRWPPRRSR